MASLHTRREAVKKPRRHTNILLSPRQRPIHINRQNRPRRLRTQTTTLNKATNVATKKMADQIPRPLIHRQKPSPSHGRARPPIRQSHRPIISQREGRPNLPKSPRQGTRPRKIHSSHRSSIPLCRMQNHGDTEKSPRDLRGQPRQQKGCS